MKGSLGEILFFRYCRLVVAARKGEPPARRAPNPDAVAGPRPTPYVRLRGRKPIAAGKLARARRLINEGGMSPTRAAEVVGIGRSTVYAELAGRRKLPSHSDRTLKGLAAAKARGAKVGRRHCDPGLIAQALELIEEEGVSPTKAAEAVGLGRSTVYDALRARKLNI